MKYKAQTGLSLMLNIGISMLRSNFLFNCCGMSNFFVSHITFYLLTVWHLAKNVNTLKCVLCNDVISREWFVGKFGCEGQTGQNLRVEKSFLRRMLWRRLLIESSVVQISYIKTFCSWNETFRTRIECVIVKFLMVDFEYCVENRIALYFFWRA